MIARLQPRLLIVAALALALETSTHLIDFGVYDLRIRALDSEDRWSYSHVIAAIAYAAGAVLCATGARRAVRRRPAWATASALFAFLLVDNVGRLHEHVAPWALLYAPVLLALFVSLVAIARGTPVASLVYTALGLLFASLAIHALGPSVVGLAGWGPNAWGYQIKVALKEGSELAGWVLLVPALARLEKPDRPMR
jgi:hypothetical protein